MAKLTAEQDPSIPEYPEGFQAVKSSQILAIAYFEADTQRDVTGDPTALNREHKDGRLEVIFKGGSRYSYKNVLPHQVEAMLDPNQSVGKYFAANIKANPDIYTYTRMENFVPTQEGAKP